MDTNCIILRENSYLDAAQLTSEYKAVRFCVVSFIIFTIYMLIRQNSSSYERYFQHRKQTKICY